MEFRTPSLSQETALARVPFSSPSLEYRRAVGDTSSRKISPAVNTSDVPWPCAPAYPVVPRSRAIDALKHVDACLLASVGLRTLRSLKRGSGSRALAQFLRIPRQTTLSLFFDRPPRARWSIVESNTSPKGLEILLNPNEVTNEMARSHVRPREVIRLSPNSQDCNTGQFDVVGSAP